MDLSCATKLDSGNPTRRLTPYRAHSSLIVQAVTLRIAHKLQSLVHRSTLPPWDRRSLAERGFVMQVRVLPILPD